MSKGLFIGRFQPFHLGHLSAIRQALEQIDSLIIGIGSAQFSRTETNPFTWEERKEMIERSLLKFDIYNLKFKIIPIPDINNNEKWPAHVRSLVSHFDVLFIGNDGIVKGLFEKYDPDKAKIKKVKEEIPICATKIREEMCKNGNWKKYLPQAVIEYIEEIDGVNRIRQIGSAPE